MTAITVHAERLPPDDDESVGGPRRARFVRGRRGFRLSRRRDSSDRRDTIASQSAASSHAHNTLAPGNSLAGPRKPSASAHRQFSLIQVTVFVRREPFFSAYHPKDGSNRARFRGKEIFWQFFFFYLGKFSPCFLTKNWHFNKTVITAGQSRFPPIADERTVEKKSPVGTRAYWLR